MKKHPTTTEQKGQILWESYDHQKPEAFWKKYEALLANHQTNLTLISAKPSNQIPLTINSKTVFHPATAYLLQKLFVLALPLFAVAFLIYQLMLIDSQVTWVILLVCLFMYLIYVLSTADSVCSFEITDDYLITKNPLLFSKTKTLWRRIQAIDIQQTYTRSSIYYAFVITGLEGSQQKYRYKLSLDSHQLLYQELSKRITQVDHGDYQGF